MFYLTRILIILSIRNKPCNRFLLGKTLSRFRFELLVTTVIAYETLLYFKVTKYLVDCNWTRTHKHLVCKWTLNHLVKVTKWFSWIVSSFLYGAFVRCICMFLSVTYAFQSESTLYICLKFDSIFDSIFVWFVYIYIFLCVRDMIRTYNEVSRLYFKLTKYLFNSIAIVRSTFKIRNIFTIPQFNVRHSFFRNLYFSSM